MLARYRHPRDSPDPYNTLFYFTVRYLRSFAVFLSLFFLSLFFLSVFLSFFLGSCISYRASRIPSQTIDRNVENVKEDRPRSRGKKKSRVAGIHFSGECNSRGRQTQPLLAWLLPLLLLVGVEIHISRKIEDATVVGVSVARYPILFSE